MSCLAEICFLFLWLVMHDLISAEVLRQYRRWWILSSFVLGALLTPPDVVSQLCMAIPLILVFEITSLIFHLKSGFFPKEAQNQPKWKKQQLERK